MSDEVKRVPVGPRAFALVDAADYPVVMAYTWGLSHGYAKANVPGKSVRMHRFLLDAPEGALVDHANGNRLDNRRCNIRLCDDLQNSANRKKWKTGASKYKGVGFKADCERKWRAQMHFNKKYIYLGTFYTEEEAARAFDAKARELQGEFAYQNFPNTADPPPSTELRPVHCKHCESVFTPRNAKRSYCSPSCRWKAHAKRRELRKMEER